jgi:hypothetical protein
MANRSKPALEVGGLQVVEGATTIERINNFLALQPTVEDDPTETMLEAILQAPDPSQWEKVFNAAHFKDSDKQQWRVNSYRVSPSQFNGKLKWFLILDVIDLKTGEKTVATCGSEMAVAQLLNAQGRNSLPIDVEVVRKPTPTKAGFHPMRFRYLGDARQAPLGDPGQVVSEQ